MRGRWMAGVLMAGVALGTLAQPAHAGGWWSFVHLDGPWLGVGETVEATAAPLFGAIAAADEARGSSEYYAYLLQGVDERMIDEAMRKAEPGDWWTPPDAQWQVGTVGVFGGDANVARVSAEVTVPDVEPGEYWLMFCTDDCARPLANIVPVEVTVSGDAALAREARRLFAKRERLRSAASRADHRLDGARDRLRDARDTLRTTRAEADELADRVDELTATPGEGPGSGGSGGAGLVWFAAGMLAGGLVVRRRGTIRSRDAGASGAPAPAHR